VSNQLVNKQTGLYKVFNGLYAFPENFESGLH